MKNSSKCRWRSQVIIIVCFTEERLAYCLASRIIEWGSELRSKALQTPVACPYDCFPIVLTSWFSLPSNHPPLSRSPFPLLYFWTVQSWWPVSGKSYAVWEKNNNKQTNKKTNSPTPRRTWLRMRCRSLVTPDVSQNNHTDNWPSTHFD